MGLKRFDYRLPNRSSKKQITTLLVICLIAVLAFSSYALYKMTDRKDVTNSKVGEFTTADVTVKVLVDDVSQEEFPAKGTGYIFDSVTCTNGATGTFNKTNWKLNVNGITEPSECTIKFVTGEETTGPEVPELNNGLIPVVYQDNKWKKADTAQKWYDYNAQWWANAVTVKAANRSTYTAAAAGTEIPMTEINTMWVWVPRYEYSIYTTDGSTSTKYYGKTLDGVGVTNKVLPGAIDINFVSQDTTTASADNFLVHPAFTFGTQQLSGIWVAKFEMSPAAGTACATRESNCDITTFAPEIKPNVSSWRYARVGTFFTAIQNKMNGSNGLATYGITNSDTHMMKNMEWGAVAYLSQSKYGKYGNTIYTGADKEVAINNCKTYYKTGVGGDTVSAGESTATCTTNTYETEKGQAASTTGNIYGIYDMSGGAWEHVMGVMKESTNAEVAVGRNSTDNSGFSGKLVDGTPYTGTYGYLKDIDTKYYDVYNYGTTNQGTATYARGHQGDGTTEVVGWYKDYTYFVGSIYPLFKRGGRYDSDIYVGVFTFGSDNGTASSDSGARPALVSAAS